MDLWICYMRLIYTDVIAGIYRYFFVQFNDLER